MSELTGNKIRVNKDGTVKQTVQITDHEQGIQRTGVYRVLNSREWKTKQ